MTSQSRKKRQTTLPNTRKAKSTKLPALRASAWDVLVAGWRCGTGAAALCAALASTTLVNPASAAERSILVAPQNGDSANQRAPSETTTFKRTETADAAPDDSKLKWRVRRASDEQTPTKVTRANAEIAAGEPSRVNRVSHSSNDSPILRAANESVLVPDAGANTARTPRKAPPRRLSPTETRTARALQNSDSDSIFNQPSGKKAIDDAPKPRDDAPAPGNRRYDDEEIPDARSPAKAADAPSDTDIPNEKPAAPTEEKPAVDKPADEAMPPMDKTTDKPMGEVESPSDKAAPATPMDEPAANPMRDPVMPDPAPMEEPLPDQRGALTPAEIKEYCDIEAKRREEILRGAPTPGGGRRVGEIEYCDSARDELRRRKVVDISVDISPSQPMGDDAPKCDRDWTDITGKRLFHGRPFNYNVATGEATFRTSEGKLRTLKLRDLSKTEQGHFLTLYKLPVECILEADSFHGRSWCASTFTWKASAACHKPLYFEDVHLERYGHSICPIAQPFISAGHFFGTLPILPYKMGLEPPTECVYSLGYYRPGNCAPHMLDPLPISARAAAMEAGAWVGGVVVIP